VNIGQGDAIIFGSVIIIILNQKIKKNLAI
jgi:hypothetical protein